MGYTMLCVLVFILHILTAVKVESACDRYKELDETILIAFGTKIYFEPLALIFFFT